MNQQYFPKPSHFYCDICLFKFIDYKEHISSILHNTNFKKDEVNFRELDEIFDQTNESFVNKEMNKNEPRMLTSKSIFDGLHAVNKKDEPMSSNSTTGNSEQIVLPSKRKTLDSMNVFVEHSKKLKPS